MSLNFDGIEIADEHKNTLLEQFNTALNEEKKLTNTNTNKAMDSITNAFQDLTGIQRLASETNGYKFIERAIPEHLAAIKNTLETEYNSKLESATGDEALKTEFERLKAALEEKNTKLSAFADEKEAITKEYESKLFNGKKERAILSIMPPIDASIDEYRVKALTEIAIQEIETENEKIHFNKDGVLVATKDFTDYKYETLLADKLKDLAPKESVTGGNALATKGANKPATSIVFTSEMSTSEKNQLLEAFLQNAGYTSKVSSVNGVPYSTMYTKLKNEANEALK